MSTPGRRSVAAAMSSVGRNGELRLFVDGPSGLGHQASSLLVLESLIADPAHGGFGYDGQIRVIYDGGQATHAKLTQMLPRLLESKHPVRMGGASVALTSVEAASDLRTVPLGLTGGADGDRRLAELTRTETFLRLQPYRWADMWPAFSDKLQFAGGAEDVALSSLPGYGRFAERAYHVQVSTPPWLGEERPSGQRDLELARILEAAEGGRIRTWPVYGVRTTKPELRRMAAEILFTLSCAALIYQDACPGPPVVILLLDRVDQDAPERPFDRLQTLLAAGPTQCEERAGGLADYQRARFARASGAACRVRASPSLDDAGVSDDMRWVERVAGRALVVNVFPKSTAMFRRCIASASLPLIFEGCTTASLALTLGRPYLHVARIHILRGQARLPSGSLYPSAYVEHPDAERLARCCQEAANQVAKPLESWPAEDSPPERLAAFLAAVEPGSLHELASYFRATATAYGNLAHDRLRLGLAAIDRCARTPA